MGRKPLGDVSKSHMMRIRMSESERAEIDDAASAAGLTTSAWARDLLLSAARAATTPAATPAKKPPAKPKKTDKPKA